MNICARCRARIRFHSLAPVVLTKSTFSRASTSSALDQAFGQHEKEDDDTSRDLYRRPRQHPSAKSAVLGEIVKLQKPSLGNPTEVLVLRQRLKKRRNFVARPRSAEDFEDASLPQQVTSDDLFESMHVQDGAVTDEDVDRLLESLRPSATDGRLSQAQIDELVAKVANGFTTQQLDDYLKRSIARTDRLKRPGQPAPTRLQSTEWKAGVTPFAMVGTRKSNFATSSTRLKERLAGRIIHDCWGSRVRQHGVVGELEIQLETPRDLSLLLSERRQCLQMLAERHTAKIDVSRFRRIIRVTADQDAAEALVWSLDAILKNVQSTELDLRPLRALTPGERGTTNLVGARTLDLIAQLTGTVLEVADGGDTLKISNLGPRTNDADDVRRLLLATLDIPGAVPSQLFCEGPKEAAGSLYPTCSKDGLDRHQQQKEWLRLECVRSKEVEPDERIDAKGAGETEVLALHERLKSETLTSTGSFQEARQSTGDASMSAEDNPKEIVSETYVLLGQVIHRKSPLAGDGSIIGSMSAEQVMDRPSTTRSFSYTVPGLVRHLHSLMEAQAERRMSASMLIRLIPSPWTLDPSGGRPPPIEIEVELDPISKRRRSHQARAVLHQSHADVMLPEQVADLRVVRRSVYLLDSAECQETLSSFLDESSLQIQGRAELRTPASVQIKVPRWTTTSEPSGAASLSDAVPVEYLYAGLEYRETAHFEYAKGLRAQYTTVEAGRFGGRWAQLRLLGGDQDLREELREESEASRASSSGLVQRLYTAGRRVAQEVSRSHRLGGRLYK